jgi:hypothetical protein
MELEQGYRMNRSTGSSRKTGYSVEARVSSRPLTVSGQTFDNNWVEVKFQENPSGIPSHSPYDQELSNAGLLGYSAAQALRWWLHASAEYEHLFGCDALETRLVRFSLKSTSEVVAVNCSSGLNSSDSEIINGEFK